jgi:hypothetical protein
MVLRMMHWGRSRHFVFDLYFDPSWSGAGGLCGGGREIASAPVGFASFSGLCFRLSCPGLHVGCDFWRRLRFLLLGYPL